MNLTMALVGEVGELLELFQWLTEAESYHLSNEQMIHAEAEVSACFLYTLRLNSVSEIDLIKASTDKIEENILPINVLILQKSILSCDKILL